MGARLCQRAEIREKFEERRERSPFGCSWLFEVPSLLSFLRWG